MKTLIILGHPHYEYAKLNRQVRESLSKDANITYKHIDSMSNWDIESEQKEIEKYDQIIIQYPIYWFSMPGKLKLYVDEVFNNQWAYGKQFALKGKKMGYIMTSGNKPSSYYLYGLNPFGPRLFMLGTYVNIRFFKAKSKGIKFVYMSQKDKLDKKSIKLLKWIKK